MGDLNLKEISLKSQNGDLKEIFDDINYDFKLIAGSGFYKGIKGDSFVAKDIILKDENRVTDQGKAVLQTIYKAGGMDKYAVNLPDKVIGYYVISEDDTHNQETLIYTSYGFFSDPRIQEPEIKDKDFKDASCIFYGVNEGGSLVWKAESQHIPTIGFSKAVNTYTWWYGDIDTQIPCVGIKGNDGAGSELYLFRSTKEPDTGSLILLEEVWSQSTGQWVPVSNTYKNNTFAFLHKIDADGKLKNIYFAPIYNDGTKSYLKVEKTSGLVDVLDQMKLKDMLDNIGNHTDYTDSALDSLYVPADGFNHEYKNESGTNALEIAPSDNGDHNMHIKYNVNMTKKLGVKCDTTLNNVNIVGQALYKNSEILTNDSLKPIIDAICPIGTIQVILPNMKFDGCIDDINNTAIYYYNGVVQSEKYDDYKGIVWQLCNGQGVPDLQETYLKGTGTGCWDANGDGKNNKLIEKKHLPDHKHSMQHYHGITQNSPSSEHNNIYGIVYTDAVKDESTDRYGSERLDPTCNKSNWHKTWNLITTTVYSGNSGDVKRSQGETHVTFNVEPKHATVLYWIRVQ